MGEILVLQETDWWKKLTQKEDDTFYRGNNRRSYRIEVNSVLLITAANE
ncbi:hypothetical protein JL09_g1977 [Pichia kudriavzevii]|uniref:Uncharacterized protein n=1 Tax=Pichia kudriavzevii TaxID=4909 RepID=A0A099P4M3_PICKU|nr:hypothetical protein JL09_g1977 [Pichia kudriavzevii]